MSFRLATLIGSNIHDYIFHHSDMYSSHNKTQRDTHSVLSAPQVQRRSETIHGSAYLHPEGIIENSHS
ncbi:19267_t:CDS:2 [Racocetra fulgida]|uniref:19267_t:CDS:1 n=1 Tax=Racocetra fulgida TaxID=60492 RepID=A0A9N8ZHK8_9GLOM|nr:19267_t:CDS:2 [Racocetra fulgida]